MAQGIFYVLDNITAEQHVKLLCRVITDGWREQRSVRVWCADQAQAEQLDQALWQQPADAFVPHNLVGEGPANGAPVELCWPGAKVSARRTGLVVNCTDTVINSSGWTRYIDFVPSAEQARQAARERYKQLRQHGVELQTIQAAEYLSAHSS
jgi:DNA polymerase-3 subunit chi